MKFITIKLISKETILESTVNQVSCCLESIDFKEYSDEVKKYFLDAYGTNFFDLNGNQVEDYQPMGELSLCFTNQQSFFSLAVSTLFDEDSVQWLKSNGYNPKQKNYGDDLVILGYEVVSSFGTYSANLDNIDDIISKANRYGLLDSDTAYNFKLYLDKMIPEHTPWIITSLSIHKNIKGDFDNLLKINNI